MTNNRRINKQLLLFIIILTVYFSLPFPALADEGQGTGGNGDLTLVNAQFVDGTDISNAGNVSCSAIKMKLAFSKNVTDDLVWENNKSCISVLEASGNAVKADIFRISSDQNSDERRNIYVDITETLKADTDYQVHIRPDLVARNRMMKIGDTTGNQDVVLSFHTIDVEKGKNGDFDSLTEHENTVSETVKGEWVSESTPEAVTVNNDEGGSSNGVAVEAENTNLEAAASGTNMDHSVSGKNGSTSNVWLVMATVILAFMAAGAAVLKNKKIALSSRRTLKAERKYLWNLTLKESLGSTLFGVLTVIAGMMLHIPLHIPAHRGLLIMTMMTIGCLCYRKQGTGILIGGIAGFLAVMLGVESKGIFGFFNYFFPGLLMDFLICVIPYTAKKWYLTGLASGVSYLSKLFSMYLAGIITGIPMGVLGLGLSLAAFSHFLFGLAGGIFGYFIYAKTPLNRHSEFDSIGSKSYEGKV